MKKFELVELLQGVPEDAEILICPSFEAVDELGNEVSHEGGLTYFDGEELHIIGECGWVITDEDYEGI